MENYYSVLKYSTLFWGIDEKDFTALMDCLGGLKRTFKKDEVIFQRGDVIHHVGVVVQGSVCIVQDDFWGNRSILGNVEVGGLFGEVYACLPQEIMANMVLAKEKSEILFLDMRRITTTCTSSCNFHSRLIHNLLKAIAEKNLSLTQKIRHTSKRTTRDKILSYLSAQSEKAKSSSFQIPFNRQQLADYLAVDRSAMSSALGKLKEEGMIEFHKNHFILKQSVRDKME